VFVGDEPVVVAVEEVVSDVVTVVIVVPTLEVVEAACPKSLVTPSKNPEFAHT